MDLPGYVYNKNTKRYYRIPENTSNLFTNLLAPVLTSPSTEELNRLKQQELEKKIDSTIDVLNRLQLHDGSSKSKLNLKFNSYDSILASRFMVSKFKFNCNIYLDNLINDGIHFLDETLCTNLVCCPEKDLLIGVWKNQNTILIAQIDVKTLLTPKKDKLKLICKNHIHSFANNYFVQQLLPVILINSDDLNTETDASVLNCPTILFCLLRHYNGSQTERSSLSIDYLPDLNGASDQSEVNSSVYEFQEVFISCDCYLNNKFVLGGENKISLFDLTTRNQSMNLIFNANISLNRKGIVQTIKFSGDGNRIFCGTNRGDLHVVNLTTNNTSQIANLNCGSIVHLDIVNESNLIVSAHNHLLLKLTIDNSGDLTNLMEFKDHYNVCRNIKFSIDRCFNTLICCGQDNCIRIWSIQSGELIRIIDFREFGDKVLQKEYTNLHLLDERFNQSTSSEISSTHSSSSQSSHSLQASNLIAPQASSSRSICSETSDRQSQTSLSVPKSSSSEKLLKRNRSPPITPSCIQRYSKNSNEQYQIVSSTKWKCLNKEPKCLMIGSIADSVDLFF